jgi:DNA-binding SARP family transcriptional activator
MLGGFRLLRDGEPVSLPNHGQRLIALLGLTGPYSRTATAGTLWPDVSEQQAQGSLRTALWRLKRLWPELVIAAEHRLALSSLVEVDTAKFVSAAMRTVEGSPAQQREQPGLGNLAAGELLPGWYDDWVVFERERLRQLQMHALERLSEQFAAERRFALALEAALKAVRMEPLRESAHASVIAVHLAESNIIEARRHYEHVRRLLWAELQIDPSPHLRAMVSFQVSRVT